MNNPLKYTDPTGYVWQGPMEPDAPTFTSEGMSYNEDYNRLIYNPVGNMVFDAFGAFDKAHSLSISRIGFSRKRMQQLAVHFALMQLKRNTFTNVQKITTTGNFIYVAASPPPASLISNMQLLYNEEFGIYVQRDKSTGDFYQPYSNIKVDPGVLVYNAKLKAFLNSMIYKTHLIPTLGKESDNKKNKADQNVISANWIDNKYKIHNESYLLLVNNIINYCIELNSLDIYQNLNYKDLIDRLIIYDFPMKGFRFEIIDYDGAIKIIIQIQPNKFENLKQYYESKKNKLKLINNKELAFNFMRKK